jgi:hypothetical protein
LAFDRRSDAKERSHEQRRAVSPLAHWLQRPLMKKEATPKHKGLRKRTSDKKEVIPKCSGGGGRKSPLIKKGAIPKRKGLTKKPPMKKEPPQNERG